MLNLDGAVHGIDHTGKLGQQIITGRIDHPAAVLLDERGDHLAVGGEGADGGFFIVPHETAVACDIGAEDRRQLAFHADCGRLVRHHFSSLTGDYPARAEWMSMLRVGRCMAYN